MQAQIKFYGLDMIKLHASCVKFFVSPGQKGINDVIALGGKMIGEWIRARFAQIVDKTNLLADV